MTNAEKVRFIFRKFPETKFNRANFFWQYLEEFYKVQFYITETQFKEFYSNEFWGLERSVRDILKEKEFQLSPELEAKRFQKEKEFLENYKK